VTTGRLVIASAFILLQAALLARGMWAFHKTGDGLNWAIASVVSGLGVTLALHG